MTAHRYHVTVALRDEPDPIHEALALSQVFSTGLTAVVPDSLTGHLDTSEVDIGFDHLADELQSNGAAQAATDVLRQLHVPMADHSVVIPAVKALLAVDDAARRAGLAGQQHLTLEVEPERGPPQRWDEREEL